MSYKALILGIIGLACLVTALCLMWYDNNSEDNIDKKNGKSNTVNGESRANKASDQWTLYFAIAVKTVGYSGGNDELLDDDTRKKIEILSIRIDELFTEHADLLVILDDELSTRIKDDVLDYLNGQLDYLDDPDGLARFSVYCCLELSKRLRDGYDKQEKDKAIIENVSDILDNMLSRHINNTQINKILELTDEEEKKYSNAMVKAIRNRIETYQKNLLCPAFRNVLSERTCNDLEEMVSSYPFTLLKDQEGLEELNKAKLRQLLSQCTSLICARIFMSQVAEMANPNEYWGDTKYVFHSDMGGIFPARVRLHVMRSIHEK